MMGLVEHQLCLHPPYLKQKPGHGTHELTDLPSMSQAVSEGGL